MARKRKSQTKLLIIPCSGEETEKLARDVHDVLRDFHGLENHVEILDSARRRDIPSEMIKDHCHELVSDYFSDAEAQVDIGRNQLKDVIRGKHIALVEHMLTPTRKLSEESSQIITVNDHIMQVRGFLDVIKNTETLKRTLLAPFQTYVRSHSIPKYRERGFFQFDSLKKTLEDYRHDGLDALVTIDPHSQKASQIANDLGIEFHGVNPFQSGRSVNPFKIGLYGDKAKQVMKHLRPFQERFKKIKIPITASCGVFLILLKFNYRSKLRGIKPSKN